PFSEPMGPAGLTGYLTTSYDLPYLLRGFLRHRKYGNKHAAFGFGTVLDVAIHQREQGVVFTQTHVLAGMPFRAPLARKNVAGDHLLAAKNLDPQPLTVRVAAVTRGSACLLVSHRSPLNLT